MLSSYIPCSATQQWKGTDHWYTQQHLGWTSMESCWIKRASSKWLHMHVFIYTTFWKWGLFFFSFLRNSEQIRGLQELRVGKREMNVVIKRSAWGIRWLWWWIREPTWMTKSHKTIDILSYPSRQMNISKDGEIWLHQC